MTDEEKKAKEAQEKKEKEDALKAKEEKVFTEVSEGIAAIRQKYEALEKSGVAMETAQTEIKENIEKVIKKTDQIEVEQKKLIVMASSRDVQEVVGFKEMLDWMRNGKAIENAEELKVMKLSDATLGGYLASAEISGELLKDVVEYSPIRTLARVRTTSKESIKIRKRTGQFSAAWTGETGTKTERTGLTYGQETIPNHELYAFVDISNWDLEDSDFNLDSELRMEFGEQFGVAEGTAFVSGDSVAKPEGILTNASVGETISGHATTLLPDGFFTLYFAPKSVYAKRASWVMNRSTMLAASILKDTTNQYLLRRLGDSPVWNILGSKVEEAVDMPNVGAGLYPVLFGDFKKGYTIADRIALAILRDPYSAATTNCVRFHARKRVGGQVVQAEAIKKMKISAT
jgi:HK97 family phage major capsid protein